MTKPPCNSHLKVGREVIQYEAKGLLALTQEFENIDSFLSVNFQRSIEIIKSSEGRIIVSGMGKSGHIGRKIAATLASTGEPASFVHPGEASHGDLGMISQKDVVLALSNSGETAELADIIHYCSRFNIPLIAITSGKDSALSRAADACLLLPHSPEACEDIRAPTTSTTMTLAIGDALSVALLRDKGFKAENFKNFHPGGKLGAGLRKVRDVMNKGDKIPLALPETRITQIVKIIALNNYGCVAIVENNRLKGVITDGDIRRNISKDIHLKTAQDIMSQNPVYVTPDMLAADALAILNQRHITTLFVCEDKRPIGILHIHDFLELGVL